MRRRTFLAAGAAATAAGLAGCSARGSPPAPTIPQSLLDDGGWEQYNQRVETVFEQTYFGVTVTAEAHTLEFEDVALRAEVREKTLGAIDARLAVLFASKLAISPDLSSLPVARGTVLDEVETAARDQFRTQLSSAGLADVSRTSTGSLTVDTGESARLTEFSANYPFEGVSFPVTGEQSVSLPGGDIAVEGLLAVWTHGGYVLLTGGAYPAENYADSVTRSLSDAITVGVDVDLGLSPDAYRSEARALVKAVE